jgi:hypothetical protein
VGKGRALVNLRQAKKIMRRLWTERQSKNGATLAKAYCVWLRWLRRTGHTDYPEEFKKRMPDDVVIRMRQWRAEQMLKQNPWRAANAQVLGVYMKYLNSKGKGQHDARQ